MTELTIQYGTRTKTYRRGADGVLLGRWDETEGANDWVVIPKSYTAKQTNEVFENSEWLEVNEMMDRHEIELEHAADPLNAKVLSGGAL